MEMKPCKYCGAKPTIKLEMIKQKDWFVVECGCAGMQRTPPFSIAELAMARWNRQQ